MDNVPEITIRNGQMVWLERLTPEICRDVQGRYWYYPAGSTAEPQPATASSGYSLRSAGRTTVSYDGTIYLIITTDEDGNLCYGMPQNQLVVKSNGEIVSTDPNAEKDIVVTDDKDLYNSTDEAGKTALEKDYAIGQIGAAGNITITMDTPVASLVNGNPDPAHRPSQN